GPGRADPDRDRDRDPDHDHDHDRDRDHNRGHDPLAVALIATLVSFRALFAARPSPRSEDPPSTRGPPRRKRRPPKIVAQKGPSQRPGEGERTEGCERHGAAAASALVSQERRFIMSTSTSLTTAQLQALITGIPIHCATTVFSVAGQTLTASQAVTLLSSVLA